MTCLMVKQLVTCNCLCLIGSIPIGVQSKKKENPNDLSLTFKDSKNGSFQIYIGSYMSCHLIFINFMKQV